MLLRTGVKTLNDMVRKDLKQVRTLLKFLQRKPDQGEADKTDHFYVSPWKEIEDMLAEFDNMEEKGGLLKPLATSAQSSY